MSTDLSTRPPAPAIEPQNGAATATAPRPPAPVPAGPPPDFVADLISAEIIGRWIDFLDKLSNPELRELRERLYPSPTPSDGAKDGPSGGDSPDAGTPPGGSGQSIIIRYEGEPGEVKLPGVKKVDITIPIPGWLGGGGKPDKEPIPTYLPDGGVR